MDFLVCYFHLFYFNSRKYLILDSFAPNLQSLKRLGCVFLERYTECFFLNYLQVITHSINELSELTVPENYVKQFFDQLASKQAQAVTGVLCSTLATVISSTSTTDLRERFYSFLTKLLAEKLSHRTKKAEFIIISAVSSSIAKLLQNADVKPKQEGNIVHQLLNSFKMQTSFSVTLFRFFLLIWIKLANTSQSKVLVNSSQLLVNMSPHVIGRKHRFIPHSLC